MQPDKLKSVCNRQSSLNLTRSTLKYSFKPCPFGDRTKGIPCVPLKLMITILPLKGVLIMPSYKLKSVCRREIPISHAEPPSYPTLTGHLSSI